MATKVLDLLLELTVKGTPDAAKLEEAIALLKQGIKDLAKGRSLDDILNGTKASVSIAQLTEKVKELQGWLVRSKQTTLEFNTSKASAEIQKITEEANRFFSIFLGGKGRPPLDLKVDAAKAQIDALTVKGKQFFDLLAERSRTPIDLSINKVSGQLDLLAVKGKTFLDLFTKAGPAKVDLDLSKVSRELDLVTVKGRQLFDLIATRGKQKIDFDLSKIDREAAKANAALARLAEQSRRSAASLDAVQHAANRSQGAVSHLTRDVLFLRRAFFGLGLGFVLREVLNLVQAFDKAKQSLAAVFGESRAKEEFEFIRIQAERLGVSVTDLAVEYGKFSIASRSLGLSQEETRDVFLAVAEAGAKLALSSEQVTGALTALQQIASKGRLSMEELRQQLGDRLPGAIAIAAKAMGITEARLFAMVEAGEIASEVFLRKFPAALRESFSTDASTRIETTAANIQRFQNALQEAIDTAVRAGALEALVGILRSLTEVLRSPVTAENLKSISEIIASSIQFVRDYSEALKVLLGAFIAFRGIKFVTGALAGIAGVLTQLGVASRAVSSSSLAATAVAAKNLGGASEGAAPKIGGLAASVGALALATKNPLVLAVAGLTAVNLALFEALIVKLDAARDKTIELKAAQDEVGSQGRITAILEEQIKDFEQYSDAVALTRKEIDSLSVEGLRGYKEIAEGAKQYADIAGKALAARISQLENELKVIALSNDRSTEALIKIVTYREEIDELKKAQEGAGASSAAFAQSLSDIAASAERQGISFTQHVAILQELAKSFGIVTKGAEDLTRINFKDLNKDSQALVTSFDKLVTEGKSLPEMFEKLIPKDFADGGIKAITKVGMGFAFLIQEGKIAANVVGENLAKALDKLKAADLQKFGIQAEAAFGKGADGAKALAVILDAQLRAALNNMGLDADTAGKKVSKAFGELNANLAVIAENARTTGAQLRGALDVAINAAKTKEELLLLKQTIDQLGIASGKFGDDLVDSLTRLDDAIRIASGKIDSALGDSFKRLGIMAKSELKSIADQATVDFERIKASGQATALQLEEAWRKMADEVTKLNNGIPPINILINAVDFNAFDLIVKAAEDASARTRKAIESAIPLAETEKQARALGDAIVVAFDRGKISAGEFGQLITEVGFKIRELAVKPIGELAAAANLLGVKTRDELKAVAENTREAFSIIASSGQFTNEQLAKGAQQFMEAYLAANSGVVDSFDPVVQKAQEVLRSVQSVNDELTTMADKTNAIRTVGGPDMGSMDVGALQQFLKETVTAYRNIGVSNVQDLRIVQDIQAQIAARGRENSEILRKKIDDSAKALKDGAGDIASAVQGAGPGAGGGSAVVSKGGGVVNNFNFNGTGLTADAVKRQVMPVINETMTRRR